MLKYPAAIRAIVCFLCFVSFMWGCDKQSEAPLEPKVITKKIVAKRDVTAPKEPQKISAEKPEMKEQVPAPKTDVAAKQISKPEGETVAKQMPGSEGEPKAKQVPETKAETLPDTEKIETGEPETKLVASLAPDVLSKTTDVYDPQGKLDPFAPLFQEEQAEPIAVSPQKTEKPRRLLTPLERVDLSQLKLVAVIQAMSGDKAMVQDASGKGYIVKNGTYIGTSSGKIIEILADRIIVEEKVEDLYGKVSVQKKPLIIQKPPGE
ncbi:MAG: pilus assembly protein PilP [Proteobacteria bacterium]|nr:pilus assembly protein PilP [Pseudomonadota bacterium]